MANNFSLSPEDRLRWQQRAPRASYWFGVSDTHPFIHGEQPIGAPPPPPPYTPALPTPPAPAFQSYQQSILNIPGVIYPGTVIQLPPVNPVPIYDVRRDNGMGSTGDNENTRPPLPPRESDFSFIYCLPDNNTPALGFTVSIPLKQFRRKDTPSRAEVTFEWDIPYGDFYDRVCARMDLDPKEAILGYKFEVDPKKSIIRLPSDNLTVFNTMLEKTKARIQRARTRAVILQVHDLVCPIWYIRLTIY